MSQNATTAPEFLYSVQDTSTDGPTAIYASPCLLRGVYVNTALSAHTVIFKDNTTAVITLPASLAAGTYVPLGDIRIESSLNIDPNDSSTGNLTVVYKPFV
jgi:hypothetical protein|tara:strand:- start:214 stop:516 length:303 start_codon:yes stop_codon:yes gene_type:complete